MYRIMASEAFAQSRVSGSKMFMHQGGGTELNTSLQRSAIAIAKGPSAPPGFQYIFPNALNASRGLNCIGCVLARRDLGRAFLLLLSQPP